ncbi:MAG: hypothetical protein KBC57_13650 [Neisseriaceae bacterium]|nr:hypothetical protein [Neisseriaceae bacterium]MBP6863387.1 hypothetical protein [Neisseriaceae bacterium]
MNKLILAALLATAHSTSVSAEALNTSAIASWRASAIKDTKSMLVVNPMTALSFNYSEGQQGFNHVDGVFNVTIQGQQGASDFKLTSKILSATLRRDGRNDLNPSDTDDATLEVGVRWQGQPLSKDAELTLIDTKKGITAGLSNLTTNDAFAQSERVSALDQFNFRIKNAQLDGQTVPYQSLNDGRWQGNVNVAFIASWDGQFVSSAH